MAKKNYRIAKIVKFGTTGRCRFSVRILDADTKKAVPARIAVKARGETITSQDSRTYADNRFYSSGRFWVECDPGSVVFHLFHGFDYVPINEKVQACAGRHVYLNFTMKRWVNVRKLGWYCGENDWHMHNDKISGLRSAPDAGFAALSCRAEGLDYATEQNSFVKLTAGECRELSDRNFILRTSMEHGYPLNGHYATMCTKHRSQKEQGREKAAEDTKCQPFPAQVLKKKVRESGGIVIATHPFGCLPAFHWMTALEVYFDSVMGNYPDAFGVFCNNREAEQLMYFALLNLGTKIAGTASTDTCLEREGAKPVGQNRVYTRSQKFSYENIMENMKKGRNFVTDGHIFPFFSIRNAGPGATIIQEPDILYTAAVDIFALNKIKSVEIIRNGNVFRQLRPLVKQKGHRFQMKYEFREGETSWYAVRVRDEKGACALTNPVYFENPRIKENFKYCIMSCMGNFTADLHLEKKFHMNIACAVNRGSIRKVFLFKDGIPRQEIPLSLNTGKRSLKGPFSPYIFTSPPGRPLYLETCYPLESTGYYHIQVEVSGGTIATQPLLFDASSPNSHQISYLAVGDGNNNLEIRGWCRDIPLPEAERDPGYICWFDKDSAWEIRANFSGTEHRLREGTDLSAYFYSP